MTVTTEYSKSSLFECAGKQEVWASEGMLARFLQFHQTLLQFGLQTSGTLFGSAEQCMHRWAVWFGGYGTAWLPPGAWQNSKCRPPNLEMSPVRTENVARKNRAQLSENTSEHGFLQKNALKLSGAATDFGARRNCCVGRQFPLEMPTLTWRLPPGLSVTPTQKHIFYMTTPRR